MKRENIGTDWEKELIKGIYITNPYVDLDGEKWEELKRIIKEIKNIKYREWLLERLLDSPRTLQAAYTVASILGSDDFLKLAYDIGREVKRVSRKIFGEDHEEEYFYPLEEAAWIAVQKYIERNERNGRKVKYSDIYKVVERLIFAAEDYLKIVENVMPFRGDCERYVDLESVAILAAHTKNPKVLEEVLRMYMDINQRGLDYAAELVYRAAGIILTLPLSNMTPEEIDKSIKKLLAAYYTSVIYSGNVHEAIASMYRKAKKIRLEVERKRSDVERSIESFYRGF